MPPRKASVPPAIAENRKFTMHPDLLFSVIKNQAGTIGKAILELVMNSIDAGATHVDITLDRRSVCVADDGKGFTSETEIDEFFSTFGTPHKPGDAVYARFRMGRGQIMAFARNVWRSGPFQMTVDIQSKGLDYTLDKGLAPALGCTIDGTLYDRLAPGEVIASVNELREQCRYTPVPVYLNGERINEDMDKQKWTEVTPEAYFKIDNKAARLSIYNLGVLVNHEYASNHGVGGIVVSRLPLEVNFARNDVIKGKCPVWKLIKPILTKHAGKVSKGTKPKITEVWRDFMAQQMLAWAGDRNLGSELAEASIFPDIAGKHWSLNKLSGGDVKAVVVAPEVSLKADKIHQSGLAVVLDGEKLERRFSHKALDQVLAGILTVPRESWHRLISTTETVQGRLATYEEFAGTITDQHMILPDGELNRAQMTTLDSIRSAQYSVTCAMKAAVGVTFERRNLYAMRSDTANAYTDGDRNIFIHEKFLSGKKDGPARGIAWAVLVANLIVHEYLHSENNNLGCTHDAEFYEHFHEIVMHSKLGDAVRYLFGTYANRLTNLSRTVVADLNRLAVIEDKLGPQEAAPAEVPPVKILPPERKQRPTHGNSVIPFYEPSSGPLPEVEIVDGFTLTAA